MTDRENKNKKLNSILKAAGKVAIAFSGGVDSAYLLYEAHRLLGANVIAVTARSAAVPDGELDEAASFCDAYGIKQVLCDTEEMKLEEYRLNTERRCYYCKKEIFSCLKRAAGEHGFSVICDGSNKDDEGDYRPGMEALDEMGILSPLREAGYTKDDIRFFSKKAGLPTWDKPSFACLATRIPYGEEITAEKLERTGKAEELLRELGLKSFRVRVHDRLARIETLPSDIEKITREPIREKVYRRLKELGFVYVAVDLQGYRQGSMNEVLKENKQENK